MDGVVCAVGGWYRKREKTMSVGGTLPVYVRVPKDRVEHLIYHMNI